jgi:hypothetical protein
MKAITTKYHGATNTRGSRISASDMDGNRVSIPYPHDLSGEAVHRAAAEALCAKMGWTGELAGGATKDGYAFVFVDSSCYRPLMPPLERAVRECLPDLKHYASMHGPGPDRRLADLLAILGE